MGEGRIVFKLVQSVKLFFGIDWFFKRHIRSDITMQPNYTKDGLFHSENLAVFTEHDARWVFQPDTKEFSLVNAWWLCNIAHLAYYDETDAMPYIKKMGLTLEGFVDDRTMADSVGNIIKDTQAYILSSDNYVVLAFRGSEPDVYKDYFSDILLKPAEFPNKGVVHGGFFGSVSGQSWAAMQQILNADHLKGKPLWVTGHSLGAALSTIAAAHLEPHGVYNFGSPRVGNSVFQRSFVGKNIHRFVNCSDLVTHLPPQGMLDFQHVGILHYFDAGSNYFVSPTDKLMSRDQLLASIDFFLKNPTLPFFSKQLFLRAFVDHNVVNYTYGIWKALKDG